MPLAGELVVSVSIAIRGVQIPDAPLGLGLWTGPELSLLTLVDTRSLEPLGTPPGPVDGQLECVVDAEHQYDGSMWVRQLDPLHVTLVTYALDVDFGG